jgi:CHAD domain-containing protein
VTSRGTSDEPQDSGLPHEREAKLSVFPGFRLPDLHERVPWVVTGEPSQQVLDARYLDAADLRLIRLDITFRYRTGEDGESGRWTLKLPVPSEGLAVDRFEMEEVGTGDPPPDHLARVLKGVLRGAPLVPVARLQTQRTVIPVCDPAGRPLGTLADDVVSALEGDEIGLRFREVEFELAPGAPPAVIDAVVEALRMAGAGEPDRVPKLAKALGPRALAPPDPAVPELHRDATAALAFQHTVAASVHRLLLHDPVIRLDAGDEGIHQARVATRRLRSDLRTFRGVLDAERVEPLRNELKWLGGLLGAVRDADVLKGGLTQAIDRLEEPDRPAGRLLLERLAAERQTLLAHLHDALDSVRYITLLDAVVRFAEEPPFTPEAGKRARDVLPELADRPWRHLVRNIAGLPKGPSDEQLHRVRILAKRARYAAEAAAPVLPVAGKHAKAIADLQDVLGEHQDAVVAGRWLHDSVDEGSSAAASFAAGLLVYAMRARADRYAGRWRDTWAAANKKKLRGWLPGS